jgi:hypothetical protein
LTQITGLVFISIKLTGTTAALRALGEVFLYRRLQMTRLALFAMVAIIFLTPNLSIAEPDHILKYLINEPVSLLDFGLFKMTSSIESWFKLPPIEKAINGRTVMTTLQYEYAHNKIHVDLYLFPEEVTGSAEESKQRSKDLLNLIKQIYGQIDLEGVFEHAGYEKSNKPKGIYENVKRITEFTVSSEFKGKVFVYRTSYTDEEIYFSERPKPPNGPGINLKSK